MGRLERLLHPSLGGALGVFVVLAGLTIGSGSLSDNSFFTHLATGRLILDMGSVPTRDPYTFTAAGEPWVVQSWLAALLYATVERAAGMDGLRVLQGLLAGALAGLAWHLTVPARSVAPRLVLVSVVLVVGSSQWSERPLMFGLLGFGLVVLAAEGRLPPAWLLPVGWVWVNTHGSFPLGLVYLALAALGSRLDGADAAHLLRCARWALAGLLAGSVGPLGPRVLLFPFQLLGRQEQLAQVVEWQSPTFTSLGERAFLVQAMVAVVLLARRPSYRAALVWAVFVAAALVASRNMAVASLVLLPAMARAARGLGSLESRSRSGQARLLVAAGVAVGVVMLLVRSGEDPLRLDAYPVEAITRLEELDVDLVDHHLAAPDIVGNYLELVYGPGRRVFYDDRFDMFPAEVSATAVSLLRAEPGALEGLEDFDVELLLVQRDSPMATVATAHRDWRVLHLDDGWLLACRRGSDLAAAVGTC